MNITKHDLSAGLVRLDFQALLKTAEIAYYAKLNDLDDAHHSLFNMLPTSRPAESSVGISRYLKANEVRAIGEALTIAAETLYTLEESVNRERIEIVNRKVVKNA